MYYKNQITNKIGFFGGTPDKNWVLATQSEINAYELEQAKITKIAQCQAYLESTDWQATAFIKYNRPIDANVFENCLKANQWKVDIAACTTLEELNAININFNNNV